MQKISVLMPVYQTNETYLREAIDSVLNQSFKDFELIILDDTPSEKPSLDKVISSYNDKRISFVKNAENMGLPASRNKLIELAKGDYISIFDHDDIMLKKSLEKQVAFLDSHPEILLCGTAYKCFGNKKKKVFFPENDSAIKTELFFKNVIHHSGVMIRKSAFEKVKYDTTYAFVNDRVLFWKLAEIGKFHNLQEVLSLYRFSDDMTSKCHRSEIKKEQKRMRQAFLNDIGVDLSSEEFKIFNTYFIEGKKIKEAQTLDKMQLIVDKLIKQNETLPHALFAKQCLNQFLKRCLKAIFSMAVTNKALLKAIYLKKLQLFNSSKLTIKEKK